jgi:putative protease
MITKLNPSYNESDETINKLIEGKFIKPVEKIGVMGVVTLVPGENASIILKCGQTVITVEGDLVQAAQNRPLNEEEVLRQLNKTGESYFEFNRLEAQMDNNCFMPIKSLNELRRQAFDKLKEALIYGS